MNVNQLRKAIKVAKAESKVMVTILSENGNRDYIDSDTIIRIFIREVV